ncbi:TRAP transporter 4TM/12TM fusion protein [Stella humosa]|uniref:TRAP transporter 4TM/12TM fusion protein n=1 Tax=Stella humosa TaxID=94 RepID=A0A3N1KP37_9PROT|nr:TRAP transporter fused permease subunit [Stella humosa]ROP83473.1 TRAP transporter 4TM/12TM fusion protein [Stella humosa]BBK33255.1 C4-dicarboxylate ABC transporter [Stella humosa]
MRLQGAPRLAVLVTTAALLAVTIDHTMSLRLAGIVLIENAYYYLITGGFLAVAFLAFPARPADRQRVGWYDWVLAAVAVATGIYLAAHGTEITTQGWDLAAPPLPTAAAAAVCILALEGIRRVGGTLLFVMAAVFACYPLFAGHLPGIFWGVELGAAETVRAHALGQESIIGIPLRTVADLLIGYLLFGVALVVTGGADFFMDFANALMGRTRGGAAKVAVVSSGLQGMLSGSVVSNVITSGVMTIPAMQRTGYKPAYAAAVEAVASTGGAIMPPVMGAAAFIMASFLNMPYGEIALAAAAPAILYYLALLLQSDLYAARHGLVGLSRAEVPSLWATLKDGWVFLFAIVAMAYLLIGMQLEVLAAFAATGLLLVAALLRRRNRLNWAMIEAFIVESGVAVGQLVAILAGIGFIVGALSITGVGTAFSRELVQYAAGSVPLLLVLGAITSFILGMGMTVSSCYIFLAIVLAPALVQAGIQPLVAHLFILYYGTLSFITPPVALAAISAAAINNSNAMMVGFYSMRLGVVLFFVPFLIVIDPALVLIGTPQEILFQMVNATAGVSLLAMGFEAYLYGVGRVSRPVAALTIAAGALVVFPTWQTTAVGIVLALAAYGLAIGARRRLAEAA